MAKIDITELTIYRFRYWIGSFLVILGLSAALVFAGVYLPGGISKAEIQSVITSNSIDFTKPETLNIVDLPYHLLQKLSIDLFGVKVFSIKLASLVVAFFSAICLFLLLRRWFKPSVAVLTSLIAITTSQFLFVAQDGTPAVMYLFWPALLLLMATAISCNHEKSTRFRLAFYLVAALSLYTPLSIYMLIAIASAILLHPHLRFIIRQLTKGRVMLGLFLIIILSIPLILLVLNTPKLGLSLLGIPESLPNFANNLALVGAEFLGFSNPGGTTIMTPYFELGSMLVIAIGVYHVLKTKATAKSYVIMIWSLSLIPLVILNPYLTTVVYLPLVMLLGSGFRQIIDSWYGLFPLNPYARFVGLIPLLILVSVLITSGADRFIHGYKYDPEIAPNFSRDLKLIPKNTNYLLVSSDEYAFYKIVDQHDKNLTVITEPQSKEFLATKAAKKNYSGYEIKTIITSSMSKDSDRFYLYTNTTN